MTSFLALPTFAMVTRRVARALSASARRKAADVKRCPRPFADSHLTAALPSLARRDAPTPKVLVREFDEDAAVPAPSCYLGS